MTDLIEKYFTVQISLKLFLILSRWAIAFLLLGGMDSKSFWILSFSCWGMHCSRLYEISEISWLEHHFKLFYKRYQDEIYLLIIHTVSCSIKSHSNNSQFRSTYENYLLTRGQWSLEKYTVIPKTLSPWSSIVFLSRLIFCFSKAPDSLLGLFLDMAPV